MLYLETKRRQESVLPRTKAALPPGDNTTLLGFAGVPASML